MTDRQAAEFLQSVFGFIRLGRANEKSGTILRYSEAIARAVSALERRSPRPVSIKGRIFKRRYCPSCHERVRKGRDFCHACGQALREWSFEDANPAVIKPIETPRAEGQRAGTVIFDEMSTYRREEQRK